MARSRYRSVTYGLEPSLALTRAVAREGGRVDSDSLASSLSYSGVRNGAFLSRLANARLFGLVAGRSGEVVLTDRGRRCLSADPHVAMPARAEACMAVPLFRRVLESFSGEVLGDAAVLSDVLQRRFGETVSKAPSTARVLLESVGQAGLVRDGRVDLSQVSDLVTGFTDSPSTPGSSVVPPVRLPWNPYSAWVKRQSRLVAGKGGRAMVDDATSAGAATHPEDDGGLWIDAVDGDHPESARPPADGSRARHGGLSRPRRNPPGAVAHRWIHARRTSKRTSGRGGQWAGEAFCLGCSEHHHRFGELLVQLSTERDAVSGPGIGRLQLPTERCGGCLRTRDDAGQCRAGLGHHRHQSDGNGGLG